MNTNRIKTSQTSENSVSLLNVSDFRTINIGREDCLHNMKNQNHVTKGHIRHSNFIDVF